MRAGRMMVAAGLAFGMAAPALAADDLAADDLAAAANAAWQRGAASGLSPQTRGEDMLCAIYWEQWGIAIEDYRLSDQLLAALPAAVQMTIAYDNSEGWGHRVADTYLRMEDGERLFEEALNRDTPRVAQEITAAAAGDAARMGAVMEMLAICRNPSAPR